MPPLLTSLSAHAPLASFQWLTRLYDSHDPTIAVAHSVLVFSLVIALGLALGSIRILKVSLGIAGVLFAGLAFAHFEISVEEGILDFARDFGLILFVYTVGLQVGPGFLSSLRKAGLPLNLLAGAIVALGVLTTLGIVHLSRLAGRPIDVPTAVGLLAGGTTNTPSLAAAQQAVTGMSQDASVANHVANGYAIAYPFGILGIILTMLLFKAIFRVDLARENELFAKLNLKGSSLKTINLLLNNPNLDGKQIGEIPDLTEGGVVISRVLHDGVTSVAQPDVRIHLGDTIHAVGSHERLERLKLLIGEESKVDVKSVPSQITARRILVTRTAVIGKTIEELDFLEKYDVTITRTSRAEVEIAATPGWRFQFGDTVLAVGDPDSLKQVSSEMGDSRKTLEHPHFIPVFLGIALGVILGSIPVQFPGVPAPVKLGLAGGPLVVAILLSRLGQFGPLSWYMPRSANYGLREFGISLFLACVGLKAGKGFLETLQGDGLYWMACAAAITALPLLAVGTFARIVMKVNFVSLCGLLAGSMTDPPALQFANQMSGGESPSVAYATVYPLTMLLRVVAAQMLILLCWSG